MVIIAALALNLIVPTHEWYSPACCGGERDDGDWQWQNYVFPKFKVSPSKDKQCHVCIHKGGPMIELPECAYIQLGT